MRGDESGEEEREQHFRGKSSKVLNNRIQITREKKKGNLQVWAGRKKGGGPSEVRLVMR